MPDIFCPKAIICTTPGQQLGSEADFPVTNFSSEAADIPGFVSMAWPITVIDPPIGPVVHPPNTTTPPPGPTFPTTYQASQCGVPCVAFTQELADLCASQAAFICAVTTPPDPELPPDAPPNRPPPLFYNTPAECTVFCSDGSPFVWHVAGGVFVNTSQAAANAQAAQYACFQANHNRICIGGSVPTKVCLNDDYLGTITVTTQLTAVVISILSGALPDGLTLTQTGPKDATITGNLTTGGVFTFTIQATNPNGAVQTKTFHVSVLGITNSDALPDGQVDHPYTVLLNPTGGVPPYSFEIDDGILPTGITLDINTGLISGTPTGIENVVVDIAIADSGGNQCIKTFTLFVNGPKFTNAPPDGVICSAWNSGNPFQLTVTCAGNVDCTAGTTFAVTGGSLPGGFSMTTGGLISCSGTPTGSSSPFTVTATNGGQSNTHEFGGAGEGLHIPAVGGGTFPASVHDMVWVNTHPPDEDGSSSLAGGDGAVIASGHWNGTCDWQHGAFEVAAQLKNCHAPYMLTFTVDWTLIDVACPTDATRHPYGGISINSGATDIILAVDGPPYPIGNPGGTGAGGVYQGQLIGTFLVVTTPGPVPFTIRLDCNGGGTLTARFRAQPPNVTPGISPYFPP